jgi:hypothetical protein
MESARERPHRAGVFRYSSGRVRSRWTDILLALWSQEIDMDGVMSANVDICLRAYGSVENLLLV